MCHLKVKASEIDIVVEHGTKSEGDGRDKVWRARDAVEARQTKTLDGQEDGNVQSRRIQRVIKGGVECLREKEEARHTGPGLKQVLTVCGVRAR